VSYALYGGRFLRSALASGPLMRWGRRGPGRWITVYAHRSHAYIVVAGLRFDTSMRDRDAGGRATGAALEQAAARVRALRRASSARVLATALAVLRSRTSRTAGYSAYSGTFGRFALDGDLLGARRAGRQ